ncbi:MAG: hypothetical protein A2V90_08560 [Gammaproteobacteria bacterium RBG_16_57_12]|nr:MAG: hypothetical protein A2V90_08560 [Gammaproteobacteria bacterium RBG_16_57_12]
MKFFSLKHCIACLQDPNPDNLNNYAAFLTMIGGEQLAQPIPVSCHTSNDAFRAPERRQGKAQRADNGHSLVKRCNAALASLGGSLRARR